MAIVDGSLQLGYKNTAWFTANASLVLLVGQIVYLEQTGTYKIGDGTTQLSALSFLGGSQGVQSVTGPNVDNTDPANPVVNVSDLSQVLSEGYVANSSIQLTDGVSTELLLDPNYIQLKSNGLGSILFDADATLDTVKYKGEELATLNDIPSLAGYEQTSNKDATGGYVGLTALKINFKNVLNTFTSFFTNSNTAARTYTFQDRNGTIADDTDLAKKGNSQPIYSGKWRTIPYVGIPANTTGNHGTIFYMPYIVNSTHTVTDIGLEVSTAAIGSNVRLALYSDNNGVPGTLIEESGAIGANTLGLKTYTFASPIVLSASNQVYWMAIQASAAGIGLRATTTVVSNFYISGTGGTGSLYTQTQAFGAFPATATGTIFASSASYVPVLKAQ